NRRPRGGAGRHSDVATGAWAQAIAKNPLRGIADIRRKTMNCKETQQWLDAYYDGELDTARTLELEQHLDHCNDCAQLRQQVSALSKQIRAAAFIAPDH